MRIIGFTGQAKSGKSHISKEIARIAFEAGFTPHLISFAGALKQASAEAGFDKETNPKKYREFCQTHGAAMRAEDPDYWVKLTVKEINAVLRREYDSLDRGDKYWEQVVIIDDVRYQNEINTVLQMGGSMVHVYAGDRLPTPYAKFRKHESEKLAKAIDKTKGTGAKFQKYYTCMMPWGDPCETEVVWFDNSGPPSEAKMMTEAIAPLLLGTHIYLEEDLEDVKTKGLSEEERQALMEEIQKTLDILFYLADDEDEDEEDLEDDTH